MTIILLSGKSFSGKDTIATKLPELDRISIADTMKCEFMKQYPSINLFDRDIKEKHRNSLMKFTHQYDLKYWLNKTNYKDNCIVTDIRTIQEIEYIKKKCSSAIVYLVRIQVSDEERRKRGWCYNEKFDNSYLETELDNFDFDLTLKNETLEDLDNCIRSIKNKCLTNYFIQEFGTNQSIRITNTLHNGVYMRNLTQLYSDVNIRNQVVSNIMTKISEQKLKFTHILALESGGYLLGSILADKFNVGLVMARKQGKLPPLTVSQMYSMEYRQSNRIEVQSDAFDINYEIGTNKNAHVLIVDDIVVTGGTLKAGINIIKKMGAVPVALVVIQELIKDNKKVNFEVPLISYVESVY